MLTDSDGFGNIDRITVSLYMAEHTTAYETNLQAREAALLGYD